MNAEHLFHLVHQVERRPAWKVHFIDQRQDRNLAEAADLEKLSRLRLHAFGGINHHDRTVGRRERPVRVLGKILVARRVEDVDDGVFVCELHRRRRNRNPPFLFHAHPVRRRGFRALTAADHPRGPDHP